ncbi:EAL domain-containing protein [Schlegelella sp. S2-27]|uniref:EAL domain-containing protein n=1 Tax=Caldimonas mangrovi TaxID=2944811 RepID=A0ABT0YM53_9BURK|nr:EAL domain-containing protein [Caldimonas mangrovi]MCM5679231.1 EAL domain-containing protein [Caldimonas mangrovi]
MGARSFIAYHRDVWIACGAMLLAVFLLTAVQYVELDRRFRTEMRTQAQIVGQNTSAALIFNAAPDAFEALASLQVARQVLSAELLRPDGTVFATYRHARPDHGWLQRWAGVETVQHAITVGGQTVGRLVVHADRSGILRDLAKFWAGGVAVMAIALGLSSFVSRGLRATVRAAQERNRYLALHDALTGLPNRAAFQDALSAAVERANRQGRLQVLMFIDVDNFKQINDATGHGGGDRVLREVGERLRRIVRPGDMVARIGGDEFGLLIEASSHPGEAASRIAADLVEQVPRAIDFEGETLRVSISIGIALLPRDARTADDAMQCADAAMYQAKREGKDAFRFFSAQLGEEIRRRSVMEAELRAGLAAGQLQLHYQPVYDPAGRIAGMEALARWQHPVRGMVPPSEFIALAESTGLIVELGLEALRVLRADIDAWKAQGLAVPRVALNLASTQFRRDAHRRRFMQALDTLQLTPEDVEFELTETAVFEDIADPDSVLRALRRGGYLLAIDDFGTGYSSLSFLRRLKCPKLKIDRSFVRDIERSEEAVLLIGSIIDVAHALSMQVVAEGVETEAERERLLSLGCDLLQGFLMSRPLPAQAVPAALRAAPVQPQQRLTTPAA